VLVPRNPGGVCLAVLRLGGGDFVERLSFIMDKMAEIGIAGKLNCTLAGGFESGSRFA
jgi:hypothetical protein